MVPAEVRDFLKVLYRVFLIPYMERGECTHRTEDRLYPTWREWKGHKIRGPNDEPVMIMKCACGAIWADMIVLKQSPHGQRLKRIPIRVEVENVGNSVGSIAGQGGGGDYGPGLRISSQEGLSNGPVLVPVESGRGVNEGS